MTIPPHEVERPGDDVTKDLADELERLAKEATTGSLANAARLSAEAELFGTLYDHLPRILSALRGEQWQGIETAGDVVGVPRKLLVEVLTDYVMMAGTPRPDPLYALDVKRLGSRIGYGAMMQSASASWSEAVRGGEFCVGPCRVVAISTRDRLAALLPPPPKGTSHE